MQTDTSSWSGEGLFTQLLVERLSRVDCVGLVRVEDAPSTRSEADYNFISNEIYVAFTARPVTTRRRFLGLIPVTATVMQPSLDLAGLESLLAADPDVGAPDYADEGMLQYLRTERVIPPYQTRGYKLVELVRVYEAGTTPRRD